MQSYVQRAIDLAIKRRAPIFNQELKELVEDDTGDYIRDGYWRYFSANIKDEPMAEMGLAFVPIGKHWHFDPAARGLMAWANSILARHLREIERVCTAMRLPRYRKSVVVRQMLPLMERLHSVLGDTIADVGGLMEDGGVIISDATQGQRRKSQHN